MRRLYRGQLSAGVLWPKWYRRGAVRAYPSSMSAGRSTIRAPVNRNVYGLVLLQLTFTYFNLLVHKAGSRHFTIVTVIQYSKLQYNMIYISIVIFISVYIGARIYVCDVCACVYVYVYYIMAYTFVQNNVLL